MSGDSRAVDDVCSAIIEAILAHDPATWTPPQSPPGVSTVPTARLVRELGDRLVRRSRSTADG